MKTGQFSLMFVVLALLLLVGASQARAQYRIAYVDLNDPSTPSPQVFSFNEKGEVVGFFTRREGNDIVSVAFLWRKGKLIELAESPMFITAAADINRHSQIVGSSGGRMFLWHHGKLDFPPMPDSNSWPVAAINDRGQVVGYTIESEFVSVPFLFDDGVFSLLETPLTTFTGASDINNLGESVGDILTEAGRQRPALWRGRELTVLPILPDMFVAKALSINDRSQIVGDGEFPGGPRLALIWEDEQVSQLPFLLPGDRYASAGSINDCGDAVGLSGGPIDNLPTLWHEGSALHVDELIAPDDPLRPFVTIRLARKINDRGQILASGIDSRAPTENRTYILSPEPQSPFVCKRLNVNAN